MKVIITGASGMVGEGVLMECLTNPEIESVLVVGRRHCNHTHPKLKEILHSNFFDLTPIESQLKGYDACYFCLGISSVGVSNEDYYKMTYTLTTHVAEVLVRNNSNMTFCYVSGAGTDSTEQGKLNWARVKGKTENDLMKLGFKNAFAFRPGVMTPTKGQKNLLGAYRWLGWLVYVIKTVAPKSTLSLQQVGRAMISVTRSGYPKSILEVSDIRAAAN